MISNPNDREYINILRGASILRVMLAHLGLSWFFPPYSQYISIFLPVFFFVSGAVSYNSILSKSDKKYYFINRYLSLIIPFVLFSFPFIIYTYIYSSNINIYEMVKYFIAWPSRSTYPFDMRQLWFINALILMFLISYPIFKLAVKSSNVLIVAFIISVIYIPFAEHIKIINIYRQVELIRLLDLPMQLHQTLSLINYYFLGALFFQTKFFSQKNLIILSSFVFILSVLLHLNIKSFDHLKVFFFERGTYFTSLSYLTIFLVMFFKIQLLALLNKLYFIKMFLLKLSQNSYALFLLHTPMIFIFEKYIGLDNLGNAPILALIKMAGVIFVCYLISPLFTKISYLVTQLSMLKKMTSNASIIK